MNTSETGRTRNYRKKQFLKIAKKCSEYKTKIKFIKPNGETNWFDIENNELQQIMKILTK